MYSQWQWDTQDKPSPQQVTEDDLLTICRALKGAGLAEKAIYAKIKIFADFARERTRLTGRRYVCLKVE